MKYFLPLRCMYFSNYFFQKADPAQFSDNQSGTGYVCTNVLVGCHCKREIELVQGTLAAWALKVLDTVVESLVSFLL